EAERDRHAVPEAAGRGFDAGDVMLGMAAQQAVRFAELPQLGLGDEALLRQERVEGETAVALAEHEPVAAGPARIACVVPQHIVVEDPEDLDERERGADVAALSGGERADDLRAQRERARVELDGKRIGHKYGLWRYSRLTRAAIANVFANCTRRTLSIYAAVARARPGRKSFNRIRHHFSPNSG